MTFSSTSVIQFGHYVACSQDPFLTAIVLQMTLFPYETGYALLCWKVGIDFMLLEKPGEYHVNKHRIIVLFKADFNQNKCMANVKILTSLPWNSMEAGRAWLLLITVSISV